MFILRRTQEIINRYLPPRLDWTLFCEPSPLQLDLYKQLLCHRVFRACLQSSTQTHTHLACITALKKLCNHPGLLHSTVKVKFFISQHRYVESNHPVSIFGYLAHYVIFLFRKEKTMVQTRALYTRAWSSSSQNPTPQVDSTLLTLENSWFCQTCWPPSDNSAPQTGVYDYVCEFQVFYLQLH